MDAGPATFRVRLIRAVRAAMRARDWDMIINLELFSVPLPCVTRRGTGAATGTMSGSQSHLIVGKERVEKVVAG